MPGVEVQLPSIGDSLLAHHPSTVNDIHQPCFENTNYHSTLSTASVLSHTSRPRRSHGSLSFLSSSGCRSDFLDLPLPSSRRAMDRATVNISPFRSVRQMKEPFQLKLPSSPSFDPGHFQPVSNRDSKENKPQTRTLQSPIGLRPLRSCRSDQNLVAGALQTFGLLPSPSLSDSRIMAKVERTEPVIQDEPSVTKCTCSLNNERCGVCIIETYGSERKPPTDPEDAPNAADTEKIARVHEELFPPPGFIDPKSTPHLGSTVVKPSPSSSTSSNKKRTRTATVSSATSWVPGDLSYCESWLQRVPLETPERNDEKAREANRRKFQIIQQIDEPLSSGNRSQSRRPVDLSIDTNAANNLVRLAVASKTKPKLVDISRPSSSGTTFSVPIHPPPSWRRPSTPEQRSINEISAFSPDTPQDIPDSGYVTQQFNRSSEESHEYHDDDYVDGSMDTRVTSDPPGNLSFAIDVFSGKIQSKNGYVSCYKRQYAPTYARKEGPRTPPAVSPRTIEQESLEKWWDYEWTLDQLESSIKEFPKQSLRLTSPVIILIRTNQEKALLRPFRKVFPGAPDNLIDYLCAALIAKNYLVSMASTHHRLNSSMTPPLSQVPNNLSKLDSVPEKARATLGIALPTSSKFQVTDRLIGTRSVELQKGLDRIVDKLLYSICGRQDETLKASVTVLAQVLEAKA
ncbi:hypothetical protein BGW36DRAFT_289052 [Talaromyces proteolyticus]|uniref:Uncharacterized protein n=1 Tax=Talaromyces proteolyticus TaxID=1131652 RepID=A0AAD4Q4Z0_9EURO|nr:uncharacterized protein BGW36DRAFT_289052 [Talaromyces proteolyticus]KAH8703761.1 hypothetical protein BGW36DRAFT_289052 [Talaromyces proteolyticus]